MGVESILFVVVEGVVVVLIVIVTEGVVGEEGFFSVRIIVFIMVMLNIALVFGEIVVGVVLRSAIGIISIVGGAIISVLVGILIIELVGGANIVAVLEGREIACSAIVEVAIGWLGIALTARKRAISRALIMIGSEIVAIDPGPRLLFLF